MAQPSIHQPLHPVTAWCRVCEWRWEPESPDPLLTETRDTAAENHAISSGHEVAVSVPEHPGYVIFRAD